MSHDSEGWLCGSEGWLVSPSVFLPGMVVSEQWRVKVKVARLLAA